MDKKQRLKSWLEFARNRTENWLEPFKTPQDWVHQLFPGANHALWIVGHIAWVDNAFLGLIGSESKRIDLGELKVKFRIKSQPSSNPNDYPDASEVLAIFRDRRAALLSELDRMTDDDLNKPCGPGGPAILTDVASVFELCSLHESTHAGQITMIRRALGHSPIFA